MSPQSPSDDRESAPMLAQCRIIAAALMLGVVSFTAIAIVSRIGTPPGHSFLSLFAVGMAGIMLGSRQFACGLFEWKREPIPSRDTAASLVAYRSGFIAGMALLEAAAFFNLVAFMVEGHWWTLLVVAVLLVWMLASFPTRARLQQWIEDREQLKSLGTSS